MSIWKRISGWVAEQRERREALPADMPITAALSATTTGASDDWDEMFCLRVPDVNDPWEEFVVHAGTEGNGIVGETYVFLFDAEEDAQAYAAAAEAALGFSPLVGTVRLRDLHFLYARYVPDAAGKEDYEQRDVTLDLLLIEKQINPIKSESGRIEADSGNADDGIEG